VVVLLPLGGEAFRNETLAVGDECTKVHRSTAPMKMGKSSLQVTTPLDVAKTRLMLGYGDSAWHTLRELVGQQGRRISIAALETDSTVEKSSSCSD